MFALSVRFRPSRTTGAEGRIWFNIREGKTTRSIPSGIMSADKESINQTDSRIVFGLKTICCIIEDLAKDQNPVSIESIADRSKTVLNGDNPYAELIAARGTHFPIADDMISVSKIFADSFTVVHKSPLPPSTGNLLDYIDRLTHQYREEGKNTSNSYRSTRNSLRRFLNNRDISLTSVDSTTVSHYNDYLKTRVSAETASFYMRVFRSILNHARREGLIDIEIEWPSEINVSGNTPKKNPQAKALDRSILRRIADLDLSGNKDTEFIRDMFMFCFYAQGIELVDLANLHTANLSGNLLSYNRRGKGKPMEIRLGGKAMGIIAKYRDLSASGFLFPLLQRGNRNYSMASVKLKVSNAMKAIGRLIHHPENLTFGMSRYSWQAIEQTTNLSEFLV